MSREPILRRTFCLETERTWSHNFKETFFHQGGQRPRTGRLVDTQQARQPPARHGKLSIVGAIVKPGYLEVAGAFNSIEREPRGAVEHVMFQSDEAGQGPPGATFVVVACHVSACSDCLDHGGRRQPGQPAEIVLFALPAFLLHGHIACNHAAMPMNRVE